MECPALSSPGREQSWVKVTALSLGECVCVCVRERERERERMRERVKT